MNYLSGPSLEPKLVNSTTELHILFTLYVLQAILWKTLKYLDFLNYVYISNIVNEYII